MYSADYPEKCVFSIESGSSHSIQWDTQSTTEYDEVEFRAPVPPLPCQENRYN
jgi:hypothetical protein